VDSWTSDAPWTASHLTPGELQLDKASPWLLITSLIAGWSVALIEVDIPWEKYNTINQIVLSYLNSV